jgi:hypothetical protein
MKNEVEKIQRKIWSFSKISVLVETKKKREELKKLFYSVFRQFRQAKFANGGLISSSSQFMLLPKQPLTPTLTLEVVCKIIILLP